MSRKSRTDYRRLMRMEIAARLKRAVQASGVSQNGLAKALRVTSGTMSSWLSGRTQPSLEEFAILCHMTMRRADSILGTQFYSGPEELLPEDAGGISLIVLASTLNALAEAERHVKGWTPELVQSRKDLEAQYASMERRVRKLEAIAKRKRAAQGLSQ